ncbi:tRNA (adenosine(37)-N6)-threonylcarbamoyltransferase complex ATPase subunit type 1 TsaE [Parapedobacter sp. ISTM3]|uniref:tRNA threonylcarbamoyladenosine biosynthesis protein TsaE n=1 Tax=Parapedobacter luteus TaxID=623280 RepID=A0A1T5F9Q9_9SPHI|nr:MULTISPECIES: tRNA (adenosine(37)-N6)-threonylcarbamoyltransferase complex ATPase subunit type 1 TsaE [Parapedobacter]MBK1442070.1 tRNA (adenosine(37)-N6)-threonylcarbamoyltransferase complex ATPase subunit type 1 TsaE [Parapedobacter sp. ISTM3]SKB92886.1 tRNA threonylcarbamoyladenosine biosynthesis protein TsaE [Parapedobacter luteus]
MVIEVASLTDLPRAAVQILAAAGKYRVFLFYGEMGAGKTTLIKAICGQLGVGDATSSPTFAIVNEYSAAGEPIYHFDFYRIRSEQEAFDLGYEDYFYSGNYCFIEWPEKIAGLLPPDAVEVVITGSGNGHRRITVHPQR